MEKLTDFQILECAGRWHKSATDPGMDVIVKIDNYLLTLVGKDDRTIVTWTCDAIWRINPDCEPGQPALYSPDNEGIETVEISDTTMISVVDDIISRFVAPDIEPGLSLRGFMTFVVFGTVAATLLFVFADSIASQMAGLVSAREQRNVGERILVHFLEANGGECASELGIGPLDRLEDRLFPSREFDLRIVLNEPVVSLALPGSIMVLGGSLLEVADRPEVVAGYALSEAVSARRTDPFEAFMKSAGFWAAIYLALGKGVDEDVVRDFAAGVPISGSARIDETELLAEFERAGFTSAPFARVSGRTGALLDDDPYPNIYEPLLSDSEWLRLRDICLD